MSNDTVDWAWETFGSAELGDARRVGRLVSVVAQVAQAPAGHVTQVFERSAEREGAFRLLENPSVRAEAVAEAAFDATARLCSPEKLVYVALDGSTLTLTDRARKRELGRVGTAAPSRGLHVMTALGVDGNGATVGLLAQQWWARTQAPNHKHWTKKLEERETRYWLEAIQDVQQRLADHAPGTRAWYQLDRAGDSWPVLTLAVGQQLLLTVRSCHDRRVFDENGCATHLRSVLRKQRILGHYDVNVPQRDDRPARVAHMSLRACTVTLRARLTSKRWLPIRINAVLAEEVGEGTHKKLRWILLTTAPVETYEQARAVVAGYSLRWRVEEFHRAWKKGLCNVEDTQLQSRGALVKWATILGTVAARAVRIAQLLRTTPEIPARQEFTDYEIAATFALARKKLDRRQALSFKQLVDMIADLGGFANKYSGGRPGPTVIGRGLAKVMIIAQALQNIDEMR